MGVGLFQFVGTIEDPWYLDDFDIEVEWCRRHMLFDDEQELVRVVAYAVP
jgi:hypothetical protein